MPCSDTTFGKSSGKSFHDEHLRILFPELRATRERCKVSIAAIVFDSGNPDGRSCALAVAGDWRERVRDLDPDSDLEMLGAFLKELRTRLLDDHVAVMKQLEDSFSNTIQISERRKAQIGSSRRPNIEAFAATILRQENGADLTADNSKRPPITRLSSTKEMVGV